MEQKLEKKLVNELEMGKRYSIGANGTYPFIVSSINYDRGFVLLTYYDCYGDGLVYLDYEGYFYEFPLSSLEKELL